MYVAGHADFFEQVLSQATVPLLGQNEVRVTSLGGGPGSDLLAVIQYLRSLAADNRPTKIHYRVIDKQPNWHEISTMVAHLQSGTIDIDVSFVSADVTKSEVWDTLTCANDDLVILNFFVSEVCKLKAAAQVRKNLQSFISSIRSVSSLVYNDSVAYTFYTYFDSIVASVGGFSRNVFENSRLDATADFDDVFRNAMDRFGRTPKLTSNAAFRILVRT
jgi:hypothetical protein